LESVGTWLYRRDFTEAIGRSGSRKKIGKWNW